MRYKGIEIVAVCNVPRLFGIKQTKRGKIVLGAEYGFKDGFAKPEKYITKYVAVVNDRPLESYAIRELEKRINKALDEG